jgi:Glycosyl transferase family 2
VNTIVVVPAFNEAATVGAVVSAASAYAPVIVIDDGSTDATAEVAQAQGAEVLRHLRRLGKAQALRTGIAAARARGATYVATLDGDGQHDAARLPALLAAAAPRTIVIGSRLLEGGLLPPDRCNAIRVASFFVNWSTGLRVLDTQSGFRVYPVALFDEVRTRYAGFVFETEVLLAAAHRGFTVREIPVPVLPRAGSRSRFRPVSDGTRIGTYLVAQSLVRWGREVRAAAHAVAAEARAPKRVPRHAAMLNAAAPYADTPMWGMVIGSEAMRRLGHRLRYWWNHPRRRRATVAGAACAAIPGVLCAMIAQALLGGRWPNLLTPLISALYDQNRLHPLVTEPVAARPPQAQIVAEPLAARESP